jgi:hypothetical protein
MFDGTTLIVDVETLGENSYALSLPAEDLWVAYEVVRRHVDANGVRHYSQMTEAKTTSDGYSFKFDTGDTFTCSSHIDRPTSSTLSDETGGGSGGGVLVVNDVDGTLDKTWQEIHDASANSVVILNTMGNICYLTGAYSPLPPMTTAYSVGFFDPSLVETLNYSTESASGYPTASE